MFIKNSIFLPTNALIYKDLMIVLILKFPEIFLHVIHALAFNRAP